MSALAGASSCGFSGDLGSGKEVSDDSRFFDAGQALVEALEGVDELLVIESDGVKKGGVEVADADFVYGGLVADFVRFAVPCSAFDSAAGHPQRECVGVVVAAGFLPFLGDG